MSLSLLGHDEHYGKLYCLIKMIIISHKHFSTEFFPRNNENYHHCTENLTKISNYILLLRLASVGSRDKFCIYGTVLCRIETWKATGSCLFSTICHWLTLRKTLSLYMNNASLNKDIGRVGERKLANPFAY